MSTSRHGEPFRAPIDQPYPVVAWFARADVEGVGDLDDVPGAR